MAQPLPITFADLPVGLEPLSLFDQQFQASTDGAYLKDDSVPLSALLTGTSGLAVGVAAFLGTPSSENLAAALTDKTGTGIAVFSNSPALVTPALGTPSAIDLTNATGLTAALVQTALASLPTTLPGTPGQLWWNGGVLSLS